MKSPTPGRPRTGGRLLIDALRLQGVDRIYCVPGESFLAALDALHDTPEIQLIVCRHEGAAANMAEADGKLTGRPGVCLVTRGPGATHASVGVHTAFQDSTPMLLLIGQVPRAFAGREAFQEIDHRRMFGPIAKWAAQVERAGAIPAMIAKAFRTATSGRMGPVVLAFPEDVLRETSAAQDAASNPPPKSRLPSSRTMHRFRALLARAERPLVILGGSGWTEVARRDLVRFAEANALPVAVSFRRQHLFDNGHPNYVGHLSLGISPKLAERVKNADLLIAVGTRLGEITTGGYALIGASKTEEVGPQPPRGRRPPFGQSLIHVYPSRAELGRVYRPTLGIEAAMPAFAAALRRMTPVKRPGWGEQLVQGRSDFESFTRPVVRERGLKFGMSQIMAVIERRLPPEAIVTNGAGNFAIWIHRFHRYRRLGSQLAPTSGAMGYGLPAALAAQLRHPRRRVVCIAGDGDFMMYPQELITAVRYHLGVIFIVADNGMYGTIRMHQERVYPGRLSGTDLLNPDFAALARSCGMAGTTVKTEKSFAAAFEQALAEKGPSLIDAKVDPAQLTPDRRLKAQGTS